VFEKQTDHRTISDQKPGVHGSRSGYSRGFQVTMSHLEVAITACEDFECDFKGAGPKEAMNGYF
jgi:hypothetical protein